MPSFPATDAADKVGACTYTKVAKNKIRGSYANDDAANYVTLTQVKVTTASPPVCSVTATPPHAITHPPPSPRRPSASSTATSAAA